MVNTEINLVIFFAAEDERFYEDLQDLLELTPKKYVLFIIGDWDFFERNDAEAETPVLLPGKSHGRRSLVGCSPWGR